MNTITAILISFFAWQTQPSAEGIIKKVDANMTSKNQVSESKMTVNGKRGSRVMTSRSWSEGDKKAMTEYLSPAREAGTKMLKLENELYIYNPSTDRTIKLSGHMLRQSVMGSDLSYEDMMEDRKLLDVYTAKVVTEETIGDRKVYVLELNAKVDDVAYAKRKMWIDTERYVPLKEELFAKGGQLLKKTTMSDVVQIDGRWFPKTILYKDMLKDGEGTIFSLTSVKFDQDIPDYIFTKAALKK